MNQVRRKAEEFGISYQSAVMMRIRYLVQQYEQCMEWSMFNADMPVVMCDEAIDEINALKQSLVRKVITGQVTDEMIEQARNVRVDALLEFKRGKTRCIAPDHEDKVASAFYGSRSNRLVCPVCDKKWDSIAVQQHLTGQSFYEAVRALCN